MSSSKRANYFPQIFSASFTPETDDDDKLREKYQEEKRKVFRHLYVPQKKSIDQLFDSTLHINAGPMFENNFGSQHDESITISLGNKKVPMIYPSSFDACNFAAEILENIRKKNFKDPTQIQKAMIPLIQNYDCDIIGNAQTGSGKTAAFMLPLVNEIHNEQAKGGAKFNGDSPYIIITAPSRELIAQLYEEAISFSAGTNVKIALAHGEIPMQLSINKVREGCDILVTTVGRLCHYTRKSIIALDKVRYFILDEADMLLQMQANVERTDAFEDLQFIKSKMPTQHRTFMLSATFDGEAQEAAQEFLRPNHCFVKVKESVPTITQNILQVDRYGKKKVLIDLLIASSIRNVDVNGNVSYKTQKTIVFKNGRRECDRLAIALAFKGFSVIQCHSNRSQAQRMAAVDSFTKGMYDILVSTDNVARGMNFPKVDHVINFDLPRSEKYNQYIHRIGRTGRAGNIGCSTSFFDPSSEDQMCAGFYLKVLEEANQPVPDFLRYIVDMQQANRAQHMNMMDQAQMDQLAEIDASLPKEPQSPFGNDTW